MENCCNIDKLVAAREILRSSIKTSRHAAKEIDQTGSRLEARSHNLAFLQAGIKEMASGFRAYEIRSSIDRTIGPASALLKVLDIVYDLQDSLLDSDPGVDIFMYMTNIKRLKDALKLLADNCRLVILWLDDVVRFLERTPPSDDDSSFIKLSKVLKMLEDLQAKGYGNGGVLSSAFNKLETEYSHILTEFSFPVLFDSSFPASDDDEEETRSNDPSCFPAPVIEELQAIIEVLAANNRLDKCISIYADVRIANARASLRSLNADYVDIQLSDLDSVESVEGYIDQWDKHMEFAVKLLLRTEYNLCSEVYKNAGPDVRMCCFTKIAMQCGFCDVFNFGISITKCKKEAIKLLKLLKIFMTLDKLRLDFNELFSGKFCVKIQNQTRDLVKKVVNGACEIFWELMVQVELQRASSPPPDGSIPRLVPFVTEYCNQLLEYENSSILTRVLEIYQEWNNVKFEEGILSIEIQNIMKALEVNLESWAKRYDDISLSCIFMMNNHWYLCNNTKGTLVGELMGDSWLSAQEENVEQYAELYLNESWEKLLVFLHEEGLTLFPGGRAIDRNLVKKRIGVFCEAFDEMYRKHSKWIVDDKALRWKICQLVFEAIVLPYERYLQKFVLPNGLETEVDSLKYSAESLENLIASLFQPRIGKYGNNKCTDLIDIKNAATNNHFSSTPAAA